jgi:hypothetical protein
VPLKPLEKVYNVLRGKSPIHIR